MEQPLVWSLDQIDSSNLLFDFNGKGNGVSKPKTTSSTIQIAPVSFVEFEGKFNRAMAHLQRGDSFLTNLTFRSEIKLGNSLKELFLQASAKYKLWLNGKFVFYSPETFVQITDGRIFTFPMKGTIDASLTNASEIILSDQKELAEHITIVDLLRNDLGQVSTEVDVKRFRYVEEIKSVDKSILQVSSEISGKLSSDYYSYLGDIVVKLLPAGSISGAPKKKTVEIIEEIEGVPRGYYSGVAGYFDGERLDSCVMIRFIEQERDRFYYRSGAGITSQSVAETEYQEILDKIYVPTN